MERFSHYQWSSLCPHDSSGWDPRQGETNTGLTAQCRALPVILSPTYREENLRMNSWSMSVTELWAVNQRCSSTAFTIKVLCSGYCYLGPLASSLFPCILCLHHIHPPKPYIRKANMIGLLPPPHCECQSWVITECFKNYKLRENAGEGGERRDVWTSEIQPLTYKSAGHWYLTGRVRPWVRMLSNIIWSLLSETVVTGCAVTVVDPDSQEPSGLAGSESPASCLLACSRARESPLVKSCCWPDHLVGKKMLVHASICTETGANLQPVCRQHHREIPRQEWPPGWYGGSQGIMASCFLRPCSSSLISHF